MRCGIASMRRYAIVECCLQACPWTPAPPRWRWFGVRSLGPHGGWRTHLSRGRLAPWESLLERAASGSRTLHGARGTHLARRTSTRDRAELADVSAT